MITNLTGGQIFITVDVGFLTACLMARRRPTVFRLLAGALLGVAAFLASVPIAAWARVHSPSYSAALDWPPPGEAFWRALGHNGIVAIFLAAALTAIAMKVSGRRA